MGVVWRFLQRMCRIEFAHISA